jgi:hypothetical protein
MWSNATVLFQPLGFISYKEYPLLFFVRIYTTTCGRGRIAMNTVTIDASEYHQIGDSDVFYYENRTMNITFSIAVLDPTVTFSV